MRAALRNNFKTVNDGSRNAIPSVVWIDARYVRTYVPLVPGRFSARISAVIDFDGYIAFTSP